MLQKSLIFRVVTSEPSTGVANDVKRRILNRVFLTVYRKAVRNFACQPKLLFFSELMIVLSDCQVSVLQTAVVGKRKTLRKLNQQTTIILLPFLMINHLTDC